MPAPTAVPPAQLSSLHLPFPKTLISLARSQNQLQNLQGLLQKENVWLLFKNRDGFQDATGKHSTEHRAPLGLPRWHALAPSVQAEETEAGGVGR